MGGFTAVAGILLFLALYRHERQAQAYYTRSTRLTHAPGPSRSATVTEVVVIGTVHFPTRQLTADTLYNALETVRPDVLLLEVDSSFFTPNFHFQPKWSFRLLEAVGWRPMANEENAVAKYLHFHPATAVRPFEWGQRDRFHRQHGILSKPAEVFRQLRALSANGELSKAQQAILTKYDSLSGVLNGVADSSLALINSASTDSTAQRRQNQQYHQVRILVDEVDKLKSYRSFYRVNERYWDLRNRAMAANICRHAALFPGQRLVVLTGFNHRYYLLAELRARQAGLGFRVRELGQ